VSDTSPAFVVDARREQVSDTFRSALRARR
jgi:hypothetical protein